MKWSRIIIVITVLVHFLAAACTYTQKVRDGEFAYARKQFDVAVPMLQTDYKKAKTRIERGKIAYFIGSSFEKLNQPMEAINWFQIAYDNQYGLEALEKKAFALKETEQYAGAIEAFESLGLEIGSPYEYRKEIEACEAAIQWKANERKTFQVESLDLNSRYHDSAPSIFKEGQIVFASDRPVSEGEETYKWTGNSYFDLYIYDEKDREVKSFNNSINSPLHEGNASFNANYSEMYFVKTIPNRTADTVYTQLMKSDWDGVAWSVPQPLPFVKAGINYGHASISKDGKTLYFACDDPAGWGGMDIYVVQRQNLSWNIPRLLGRSINTEKNEDYPFLDSDTLYFASDGHRGMGGYDIFRSYKLNGRWTPAQNLQDPINSGADDFGFVIDYQRIIKDEKVLYSGYFASARQEGEGSDDIYRFEKKILPPLPKPVEDTTVEEVVAKVFLDVYVLDKVYERSEDPSSKLLGRKPLDGASLEVQGANRKTKKITTDDSGLYTIELNPDSELYFLISKEGYLNKEAVFSSKDIAFDPTLGDQRFELEIVMERIFEGREIVLENIYYDYDQSFIREDAKPTLNQLARDLTLNPEIRIELTSHTDCRGGRGYNQSLSQRRAEAAVDYLITLDIDPDRLSARGYGKEELLIECVCAQCTEEEHQKNRRTAFKILE